MGNVVNFIVYVFMGFLVGMMFKRIGYKKIVFIVVVVGFIGVGI